MGVAAGGLECRHAEALMAVTSQSGRLLGTGNPSLGGAPPSCVRARTTGMDPEDFPTDSPN